MRFLRDRKCQKYRTGRMRCASTIGIFALWNKTPPSEGGKLSENGRRSWKPDSAISRTGNNQPERDNELPFLLLISNMNIRLRTMDFMLIARPSMNGPLRPEKRQWPEFGRSLCQQRIYNRANGHRKKKHVQHVPKKTYIKSRNGKSSWNWIARNLNRK